MSDHGANPDRDCAGPPHLQCFELSHVTRLHIPDCRSGRQPVLSQADPSATQVIPNLLVLNPVESQLIEQRFVDRVRAEFGDSFWGFWMLGGASGGGMGFIFAPERRDAPKDRVGEIMLETKRGLEHALPFAIEPVVYDFAINPCGTQAELLTGTAALMPAGYYPMTVPAAIRSGVGRTAQAMVILDEIIAHLHVGDIRAVGAEPPGYGDFNVLLHQGNQKQIWTRIFTDLRAGVCRRSSASRPRRSGGALLRPTPSAKISGNPRPLS